jgi:hypothetical protein
LFLFVYFFFHCSFCFFSKFSLREMVCCPKHKHKATRSLNTTLAHTSAPNAVKKQIASSMLYNPRLSMGNRAQPPPLS